MVRRRSKMSSTLSFILNFRDGASGGLRNVGGSARSSFNVMDRVLGKVNHSLNKTDRKTDDLRRSLNRIDGNRAIHIDIRDIVRANRETDKLQRNMRDLQRHKGGMNVGGYIGTAAAGYAGVNAFTTAARNEGLDTALNFATNGNGGSTIKFLTRESDLLGASLEDTKEGALSLYGAMRGGKITLQQQNKIIESVMEAGSAMQLSGEAQKGVLLAVSQMASKGVVAAEELRGQVGERLPGAFKIAADAMGMSEQKFNSYLNKGKIVADDFLPKFADQLHKTFGVAAVQNTDKANSWINRYKTTMFDLKTFLGTELMPTMVSLIRDGFMPGAKWIKENWSWLKHLIGLSATAVGTIKAMSIAQGVLNATMAANPVLLVAGAVGALIYGMTQAYGKVRWFTEAVDMAWDSLKGLGNVVGTVLSAIGLTIDTGRDQINKGLKNVIDNKSVTDIYTQAGKDHAEAYNNAFKDGHTSIQEYIAKDIQDRHREQLFSAMRIYGYIQKIIKGGGSYVVSSEDMTEAIYGKKDKDPYGGLAKIRRPSVGDSNKDNTPTGLSGSDLEDFNKSSNRITGGGARVINFTIEALNKSTYHVADNKAAAEQTAETTGEYLLRLIQNNGGQIAIE